MARKCLLLVFLHVRPAGHLSARCLLGHLDSFNVIVSDTCFFFEAIRQRNLFCFFK